MILSTLPRIAGNPHIIPGEQVGAPRSDLKRPWAAVTKAAGLEGVRLHDLRHSFASVGVVHGSPRHRQAPRTLQAATTHRYAHLDADPLRRAVETLGSTIDAAMRGEKAGNVVALPKGKSR